MCPYTGTHLASKHLLTTLLATNTKAPRPAEARRPKKAFLGLEVTPEPPHFVTKIIGLMDENSILHTNSKYSKDRIRAIKGHMKSMLLPGTYTLKAKRLQKAPPSKPAGAPVMWGGSWVPFAADNPQSRHYWLPNDAYSSSHLALCAEFVFKPENLLSGWH